jgi:L-aspartate oxidase
LDISSIGTEKFQTRFPTISALCKENNINIEDNKIPVTPAQHYFMGGIRVNLNSETTIKNLYAIGECASTGLHGANRLASNSLLECGVFARNLAIYLSKNTKTSPNHFDKKIINTLEKYQNICFENDEQKNFIENLFDKLKNTMTNNAGIIRNKESLDCAINDIFEIKMQLDEANLSPSKEKYELNNALYVASLIVKSAKDRKNSIGAHYRDDELKTEEPKERISDDKILAK